jgi:hypothetical protein
MNYRDLQNISNLSQQILVEGANEEHNVLNRWPYTSPYLQEDYNQEDYKPWDFGPKQNAQAKHAELAQRKAAGGSAPGTATRANKIASVGREMRTTLDRDSANTGTNPAKQGLQPSTQRHTAAALRGAGGGTTARTKFDVKPLKPASKGGGSSAQGLGSSSGTRGYQVGGGQGYGISGIKLADSYDLYDIILSHLLDEGYAETQEQAEVIMVNMSEEWRESIMLEQSLPSNYTDYKSPSVQAAHARSMGSASRMRQMGMNATAEDPKDNAQSNLDAVKSGSGVAKPLSGTTIRSGAGKGFKVGDPGINIRPNN